MRATRAMAGEPIGAHLVLDELCDRAQADHNAVVALFGYWLFHVIAMITFGYSGRAFGIMFLIPIFILIILGCIAKGVIARDAERDIWL